MIGLFQREEEATLLYETGFKRAVSSLSLGDKADLISVFKLHLLVRVKGETDQFLDGLRTCGVLDAIRDHPQLMSHYFLHHPVKLTAGKFFCHCAN